MMDPHQQQQEQQHHQAGGPTPPNNGRPDHIRQHSPAQFGIGLGLVDPSDLELDRIYPSQSLSNPPNAFGLTQHIDQQHNQHNGFGYTEQSQQFTQYLSLDGPLDSNPSFFTDSNLQQQFGGTPNNTMATQHLTPDFQQPGSAQHSPSIHQQQFSSPPAGGQHSRNTSLTPQDAYFIASNQGGVDWNQTLGRQFQEMQGHRRAPSDFSDVASSVGISSAAPSPHLASVDAFPDHQFRPQGASENELINELSNNIPSFSISDQGTHSPNPSHTTGPTPAHSPAISPRIMPQQMPDMNPQHHYLLQGPANSFGPPASYGSMQMQMPEQFPSLQQQPNPGLQMNSQFPNLAPPPEIQVDSTYAPSNPLQNGSRPGAGNALDVDSLTPPDRGRRISRPRAVTDPFNNGGAQLGHRRRPSAGASLSPNDGQEQSRSLSPSPARLSGSGFASLSPSPSPSPGPNRRRHSAAASNAVALRLADADAQGENGAGRPRRVQKHQANFACELCDKRFTRAYNLRSHTRTHTDERPFKCTVCGKAFARQHDRKRHEGLHSGEKKFPCKGPLKDGSTWGCGRKFARADALGRHFRSEAGRVCIKPLLEEEWRQQQADAAQNNMNMGMGMPQPMMGMGGMGDMMLSQQSGMMNMDPNGGGYPQPHQSLDPNNVQWLPASILAQYPQLRNISWNDNDLGGSGIEDEISGQSAFEASDYEDADEGGYGNVPGYGMKAEPPDFNTF